MLKCGVLGTRAVRGPCTREVSVLERRQDARAARILWGTSPKCVIESRGAIVLRQAKPDGAVVFKADLVQLEELVSFCIAGVSEWRLTGYDSKDIPLPFMMKFVWSGFAMAG